MQKKGKKTPWGKTCAVHVMTGHNVTPEKGHNEKDWRQKRDSQTEKVHFARSLLFPNIWVAQNIQIRGRKGLVEGKANKRKEGGEERKVESDVGK